MTRDASFNSTAIVWADGLTNAPAGTLIVVFDVNFLDPATCGTADAMAFTDNLISFLGAPVPLGLGVTPIPPSIWMVLIGALAIFAFELLRRRRARAA